MVSTALHVTEWKYKGVCDEGRLRAVETSAPFEDIARRLEVDMEIVCCHARDCCDKPGYKRTIYCVRVAPMKRSVALALGDDPATKQNANDENAASVEIEPSEPSSFRRHRSSIKRQKQQNSRRMTEWGILARQLQLQLHQRYPRTQHQLFRDHLARIGIDRHLTHREVERENCSGDNVAAQVLPLLVPQCYVSGNPISGTATYDNATFASLG
ncbi:MAG: hypothetical protein DMF05_01100 [Verrucomicrobia bacterium]|nr:MAG: hypothetical protein DMF05_01100 [Verrucomicrobiota bacterium]